MGSKSAGTLRDSPGYSTKRFKPWSKVERPVPPPMATTRRPRSRAAFSGDESSEVLISMVWFATSFGRTSAATRGLHGGDLRLHGSSSTQLRRRGQSLPGDRDRRLGPDTGVQ